MTTPETILVTGARAPAARELCRQFAAGGRRVLAADGLAFPLTRFSRVIDGYRRLPSPCGEPKAFRDAVLRLVERERVRWIVPTCEEVFHLAPFAADLPSPTQLFAPSVEILGQLHHKARFLELARGCPVEIPESIVVTSTSPGELDAVFSSAIASTGLVLKPVYSRFASRTLIKPTLERARHALVAHPGAWLAQRFIAGEELCSYSVAREGALAAHGCYTPLLRAGVGAGVYFQPHDAADVRAFVAAFAKKHALTGQLGFDFIRTREGRLFVLECNPRATSGVHLFAPGVLAAAIVDNKTAAPDGAPAMIGLACLSFASGQLLRQPHPLQLLRAARDAVWSRSDPWPFLAQPFGLAELAATALRHRISLQAASTRDIEWNGPASGRQ